MFVLNSTVAFVSLQYFKAESGNHSVTSVTGFAVQKETKAAFILYKLRITWCHRCPSARGLVGIPQPWFGEQRGVWNPPSLDLSGSHGPSINNIHQEATKALIDLALGSPHLPEPRTRAWFSLSLPEQRDLC